MVVKVIGCHCEESRAKSRETKQSFKIKIPSLTLGMTKNKMVTKKFLITFLLSTFCFLFSVPTSVQAARFYLEPQNGDYSKDQEFEVVLKLDTSNEDTSGIDAVFNFPKEILQVSSVSFNSLYNLNDAQVNNNAGNLKLFSTMNSSNNSWKGNDRLATIKLKGINQGEARLSFNCQGGQTGGDSNIWKKSGGDIIDCNSLQEGIYRIKSNCAVPGVPSNIRATAGPSAGEITLKWDKASGAKYYNIAYGQSSLNYQWGAPNVGDVDNYVVKGLTPGKPYYLIITGVNDCGSSGALQEVAAYAGKAEKVIQYIKEPDVVEYTEDMPAPSPSPELSSSPSPESVAVVAPINKPFPFSLPSMSGWLKWALGIIIIFIVLALLGKRFVGQEMEEIASQGHSQPASPSPPESSYWPPPAPPGAATPPEPQNYYEPVETVSQPIPEITPESQSEPPATPGESVDSNNGASMPPKSNLPFE